MVLLLGASVSAQVPGTIETIAGSGARGFDGDSGQALDAQFNNPVQLAFEPNGGYLIADQGNHRVRRVRPDGFVETIAGTGAAAFSGDGRPATQAGIHEPTDVAVDSRGNIYVAEAASDRIRRIDPTGIIRTFAGTGVRGFSGDGGQASRAQLACPTRIVFDVFENLLVADQCNHRIRRIDQAGIITTIAGSGPPGAALGGFAGDGGPATSAQFRHPTALALDGAGNLIVSDQLNFRIRRIDRNGTVTTLTGTGAEGFSGDGGPAGAAMIRSPGGLAVDAAGTIYFADIGNNRIRVLRPDGSISTAAGTGIAGTSGDGGPATNAGVNGPFGVEISPSGDLLIIESGGDRIRRVFAAAAPVPTFSAAGVVNAASFEGGGVTAGSIVSIFLRDPLAPDVTAVSDVLPLAASLGGTSVAADGVAAPLFAVVRSNGQAQINLLLPYRNAPAQTATTTDLVVTTNGSANAPVAVPLQEAQPGVFTLPPSGEAAVVRSADNTVISADNPALKGEVITIFLTGLGAVDNPPPAGFPAPSAEPFARTVALPTVDIGGASAELFFSGLTPGLVGLYQINARVPQLAPSGAARLTVTQAGASSRPVLLQVE